MTAPINYKATSIIFIVIVTLFFTQCKKDSDAAVVPVLTIVDTTVPSIDLPFDTASVSVSVKWAYANYKVIADSVIEGESFISSVYPTYFGSPDQGETETKIKISFTQNSKYARNKQKVTIKSLDGNLVKSFVITQSSRPVVPINLTVNPSVTYQTVAGFGGANTMWGTNYLSASQIKTAFGTDDTDLGLSIFRVRLSSVEGDWAGLVNTLKEAKKYGVKILASPWSPPANLKSNNNTVGGYLLEQNYAAYATYLNNFVQYMAGQGVTIDAVSVQNEPDIKVTYESCDWSVDQMYNFIKNNASTIQGTRVAASESFHFDQAYTNKLLNDASVVNNFSIVAGHIYGGGLASYPLAEQKSKEIWMTEYLMNLNATSTWSSYGEDVKWTETLNFLGTIHDAMQDNWNAYIWWYIRRYYSFIGDGEQGTTLGEVLKRGYAMSHFSKFVRPGYVRVNVQGGASDGYKMTAYKGDNKVVVVIINPSDGVVQTVNLLVPQGVSSAESYTTTLLVNRQKQTIAPQGGNVTFLLRPQSVTTVVLNL